MPKPKHKPLTHLSFGGPLAEQQNALRSAMATGAENEGHTGEYKEYDLLKDTPRTTLVVVLIEALHMHGYEIRKMEPAPNTSDEA